MILNSLPSSELSFVSPKFADSEWDIGARTMTYIPGLAQVAGADPSTGTYQYWLTDHLPSVREIRGQDKALLARYAYMPYGDAQSTAGLALNRGYTGHTWDPDTKLYFAPFRYYMPNAARWMVRDPIMAEDSGNLYNYVGARVLLYSDPMGLSQVPPSQSPPTGNAKGDCRKKVLRRIKYYRDSFSPMRDPSGECSIPSLAVHINNSPDYLGYSPLPHAIVITEGACNLPDLELDRILLHEIGHARRWFDRLRYALVYIKNDHGPGGSPNRRNPGDYVDEKEKVADDFSNNCYNMLHYN